MLIEGFLVLWQMADSTHSLKCDQRRTFVQKDDILMKGSIHTENNPHDAHIIQRKAVRARTCTRYLVTGAQHVGDILFLKSCLQTLLKLWTLRMSSMEVKMYLMKERKIYKYGVSYYGT